MARKPPPGLFITGTDTNVGKTYVTAMIARSLVAAGYNVGIYKPVASGCRSVDGVLVSDDAVTLWEAAGRPGTLEQVCPQRFAAPLAPHLAARVEGTAVDAALLRSGVEYWRERSDIMLVEGAGGLMSPISDHDYVADLAAEFGYPLIVVAANRIGVINQVLQTLIVARSYVLVPVASVGNTLRGVTSVGNTLCGVPGADPALNIVQTPVAAEPPTACPLTAVGMAPGGHRLPLDMPTQGCGHGTLIGTALTARSSLPLPGGEGLIGEQPSLTIAAVILNEAVMPADDPSVVSNAAELAARIRVPVLARVRFGGHALEEAVDWPTIVGLSVENRISGGVK